MSNRNKKFLNISYFKRQICRTYWKWAQRMSLGHALDKNEVWARPKRNLLKEISPANLEIFDVFLRTEKYNISIFVCSDSRVRWARRFFPFSKIRGRSNWCPKFFSKSAILFWMATTSFSLFVYERYIFWYVTTVPIAVAEESPRTSIICTWCKCSHTRKYCSSLVKLVLDSDRKSSSGSNKVFDKYSVHEQEIFIYLSDVIAWHSGPLVIKCKPREAWGTFHH